ncbi:MAG TPA: sulfite exporter TauE/SafE family protein [Thermoanaerobaculia bacterium]|nr:sulfite exporter TauE/SafE family protein [Thermoanaerobaculia bacterium]
MTPGGIAALVAASFGAGVMNALAGGGTILTFPTLVFLGLPAVTANATSAVALLPGAAASLFGFRREVAEHRAWLKTLFLPSLLGGAVGSVLLLSTPEKIFASLAPVLLLFATVLFMIQGAVSRRLSATAGGGGADPGHLSPKRWAVASLLQFAVALYGGYFGAGIGILMLALLGFLGLTDIHGMNGLKNFFNLCINCVAAVYFIYRGAVVWPAALVIVVGATIGGYAGARFSKRIGREKARAAVIGIGLLVTAILFWQQAR